MDLNKMVAEAQANVQTVIEASATKHLAMMAEDFQRSRYANALRWAQQECDKIASNKR